MDGKAQVFDITEDGLATHPRFPPTDHILPGGVGIKQFGPLIIANDQALFREGINSIRVVNLRTGEPGIAFGFQHRPIADAIISRDGKTLALSGDYFGTIRTYDLASGEMLTEINSGILRTPGLAFKPGQSVLATISHDSFLKFWDSANGTPVSSPVKHQGPCEIVAFSRQGTLCGTAQVDGTVRIMQMPIAPNEVDTSLNSDGKYLAHEPSLDRNGRWVVTSGSRWGTPPRKLCVFSTSEGKKVSSWLRLDAELIASAISPDGKYIAALTPSDSSHVDQNGNLSEYSARPGQIIIWDWRTNHVVRSPIRTSALPLDVVFSPDGKNLAAICADGDVHLVDCQTSKTVRIHKHEGHLTYGYALPRRMIRFTQEGDRFVTLGLGTTARIWTMEGVLLAELNHKGSLWDASFSHNGKYIVTACQDGNAQVWDANKGTPLGKPLHHPDQVSSVAFDPSAEFVATACHDHMARVWDWQTGKLKCPGLEHSEQVYSVAFIRGKTHLLTAADKDLRFWETFTGKQIASRRTLGVTEPRLSISREGRLAALEGGSYSGTTALVSLREFDSLDDFDLSNESLNIFAEIVSGRRVERGGSVFLTGPEFLARWKEFLRQSPDFLVDWKSTRGEILNQDGPLEIDGSALGRLEDQSPAQLNARRMSLKDRLEGLDNLDRFVRVANVVTDKLQYKIGEPIVVEYTIMNTSPNDIAIPLNHKYSRPMRLLGTEQKWIEAVTTKGRKPDGGTIVPNDGALLTANAKISRKHTVRRNLPPGRYRYLVEWKSTRGKLLNTESVEFEIIASDNSQSSSVIEHHAVKLLCPEETVIGELAVFEIESNHNEGRELEYQLRVAKVGGRAYTFNVLKRYQNNFTVWGTGVFKAQARVNDGIGWSNWSEEKEIICDSK